MQIQRKSYSEINRTYFFTATIHQWLPLLAAKENKELIVDYLKELSAREMIKIYGLLLCPIMFILLAYRQAGLATTSEKWKGNTTGKFFKIYRT
jgi:hypothetical protein